MIITTRDFAVGINFSKISPHGEYHSHRIYRNWSGRVKLKINFLESRLSSNPELVSYKFKFDTYDEALYIMNQYLNNEK